MPARAWLVAGQPGHAIVRQNRPFRPNTPGGDTMRSVRTLVAAALLLLPAYHVASAAEPKQGGILRVYHRDSPGSASIHEGATFSINVPFMPVFNNLVMFDQSK